MPRLEQLTCLLYDGTPKNVRLAANLPAIITTVPVLRMVFLISVPRTVPAPAEVLEGVQYGNDMAPNNGIEFVGTYVGGGTGGVSRSRVVNK